MYAATRATVALVALTTGGCAAALPAVRPWPGPPEASACRVAVERGIVVEGSGARGPSEGSWRLEFHYAADGRVLAGTTGAYGAVRGWEHFLYDRAGRLRAIEAHEEYDAVNSPFDVGDAPPRRVMTYVRVRHDEAGRLTEWALAQRSEDFANDAWSVRGDRLKNETRYAYDASGRPRERHGGNGTSRFFYEGDRLVRVEGDGYEGSTWYRTLERDGAGRVTRFVETSCTLSGTCRVKEEKRYAYDAEGRIVRTELRAPTYGPLPWVEEWAYAGGRIVRRTRTASSPGSGQVDVVEYEYDSQGRLTSLTEGGRLRETRRYEGACDALTTSPPEPSVEVDVGARHCVRSPARILDRCASW